VPNRRHLIGGLAALLPAMTWLTATAPAAAAEDDALAQATQFIRDSGNRLAALAHDSPSPEEKNRRLQSFLDEVVDVDGVARFCLGRFWRTATPGQQQDYLHLFRQVLLNSVSARVNDYPQGQMQVTISPPVRNGSTIEVPTIVARAGGNGGTPARVTWMLGTDTGRLRIIDIVAEGMSLRLTQRSDYISFLARNDNNLDTLLRALRQQLGAG